MSATTLTARPGRAPPAAKKKRSVVEAVTERLYAMIRSGKIGVGDRLPSVYCTRLSGHKVGVKRPA